MNFFAIEAAAVPYLVIFPSVLPNCLTSLLSPQKREKEKGFLFQNISPNREYGSGYTSDAASEQGLVSSVTQDGGKCEIHPPIYTTQEILSPLSRDFQPLSPKLELTEFNCPAIRAGAEKCQTIDPSLLFSVVLARATTGNFHFENKTV